MLRILAKLSPPHSGQTIICFVDSLTEGVGRKLSVCVVARTWFAGYQHRQRGRYDGRGASAISDAVWIKIPRLVIVLLGGKIFCARCVPGEIVQRTQAQSAMMTIAGVKLGLFTDEYGSIFEEMARQLAHSTRRRC